MRLILIRHAKSSWNQPGLDDHDRPLAPRGKRASAAVGKWLAEKGYAPRTVLCSTSRRTRETWDGMRGFLEPPAAEVEFTQRLYHCGPHEMLKILSGATESPALLLGHNPGIGMFASLIVAKKPEHPEFGRYPTAATLVCDLPSDSWKSARYGSGAALDFIVPRDLE